MANPYQDNSFRAICSEKTLQTNGKGFFLEFADYIANIAGETWIKNKFASLKSDKERLKFIYENENINHAVKNVLINVQEIYRKKSSEISQARRLDAEKYLDQKNFSKATMFYSQSVLRAEKTGDNISVDSGDSLSLALWGRAQSLFCQEKYEYSLRDIQMALKENLPSIYKPDVYGHMAVCYKILGEIKKSKIAFELAKKLLPTEESILILENKIKVMPRPNPISKSKDMPEVEEKPSRDFSCASKKIKVNVTKELGRYVVANDKINTGETLVVEPPYSACLLPEMFGSHCHHCFKRLIAPIGCPICSSVAFCSPKCRDEATSTYHQYECKILDLIIGSGMSILSQTALRMVTQNSYSKSMEIYKNRSSEKVYTLCTNSHLRPANDFFQRTLMAVFLLRCLQKTNYFEVNNDELIPSEDQYKIGEMILYHLQVLQFNAHEIYEVKHSAENRFKGSKIAYIGVGIYPTVSLFNHHCYPAVTRYFVGKNIIIKSIRPVIEGEIISENYGPIFTRKSLADRQRSLTSRYWFTCQCPACEQNWPMINNSIDTIKRIRCPTIKCSNLFTLPLKEDKMKCFKCKHTVNIQESIKRLQWCEEQYVLGFKEMDGQNPDKAIHILNSAIDLFHEISAPPHESTHLAQETLKLCLADLGNSYEVLVKKNS